MSIQTFEDVIVFRKTKSPLGYDVTLAIDCKISLLNNSLPVYAHDYDEFGHSIPVGRANSEVINEVVVADIVAELPEGVNYDFSASGVVLKKNEQGDVEEIRINSIEARALSAKDGDSKKVCAVSPGCGLGRSRGNFLPEDM